MSHFGRRYAQQVKSTLKQARRVAGFALGALLTLVCAVGYHQTARAACFALVAGALGALMGLSLGVAIGVYFGRLTTTTLAELDAQLGTTTMDALRVDTRGLWVVRCPRCRSAIDTCDPAELDDGLALQCPHCNYYVEICGGTDAPAGGVSGEPAGSA